MTLLERFQDVEYVNWLKAGQALLCMAEGLRDFCKHQMTTFHKELLNEFPVKKCQSKHGSECPYVVVWRFVVFMLL